MAPETTPIAATTPTSRRALNTPTTTPTTGNWDEGLGAGRPSLESVAVGKSPMGCGGLDDVASWSLTQASSRCRHVTFSGFSPKQLARSVSVWEHLKVAAAGSRDSRLITSPPVPNTIERGGHFVYKIEIKTS